MKRVFKISVRDFALPAPRVGSIDSMSGFSTSAALEEGSQIHRDMQQNWAAECEEQGVLFEAERAASHCFEREGFCFEVSGRIDGYFNEDPPRLQEIKSTFQLPELIRRLTPDHPYSLQLRTYGYFEWLRTQAAPALALLLVSTRNRQEESIPIPLDREGYEAWLERRLDELVSEARRLEKQGKRRHKTAERLQFPFASPRTGQAELIDSVSKGLRDKKHLMIQAPTGIGKTLGVLYPALQNSLARGQQVLYVTPKNSQHAVAEDGVLRLREHAPELRSLTLTAKSKICFKAEPLCNPEYCEFARDYYTKVATEKLGEKLERKKKLARETFEEIGAQFEVCPYQLQLDAARSADVVIGDYHYALSSRSPLLVNAGLRAEDQGKPVLVIDEAHNWPGRAMEAFSSTLSVRYLESLREPIAKIKGRLGKEALQALMDAIEVLESVKPEKEGRFSPPHLPFIEHEEILRGLLSKYLESEAEIRPKDPILALTFVWSEFREALEFLASDSAQPFFATFRSDRDGTRIRITCCDASALIAPRLEAFEAIVAFSATLKPFEFYHRLSGLAGDRLQVAEFCSPFNPAHRKLLIIPQVSTKFSERARHIPRIREAIERITLLKRGNYFVFFPSFQFLEQVADGFSPPADFEWLLQRRDMPLKEINEVLERLRAAEHPTLIFAVQGGVFSEGIDYVGDALIGAFIIGPPLPHFDLEREEMRQYYQRTYGQGFAFAYTFPAMAKAVQAAGRVIRTETDRGVIVLMDSRFLDPGYAVTFPQDWCRASPQELVSTRILEDLRRFWSESATP